MLGNFSCFFVISCFFSKSILLKDFLQHYHQCQVVWMQILSGLICLQTVCIGWQYYYNFMLAGKSKQGFKEILPHSILRTHMFVCMFVLMLYVPVNNLSVMSGLSHAFLGWTSTKQKTCAPISSYWVVSELWMLYLTGLQINNKFGT